MKLSYFYICSILFITNVYQIHADITCHHDVSGLDAYGIPSVSNQFYYSTSSKNPCVNSTIYFNNRRQGTFSGTIEILNIILKQLGSTSTIDKWDNTCPQSFNLPAQLTNLKVDICFCNTELCNGIMLQKITCQFEQKNLPFLGIPDFYGLNKTCSYYDYCLNMEGVFKNTKVKYLGCKSNFDIYSFNCKISNFDVKNTDQWQKNVEIDCGKKGVASVQAKSCQTDYCNYEKTKTISCLSQKVNTESLGYKSYKGYITSCQFNAPCVNITGNYLNNQFEMSGCQSSYFGIKLADSFSYPDDTCATQQITFDSQVSVRTNICSCSSDYCSGGEQLTTTTISTTTKPSTKANPLQFLNILPIIYLILN